MINQLLIAGTLALGALPAAQAALVVTLQESTSNPGGVSFNISGTGQFDGSINLTHLGFVFFDGLGDPFKSVPLFSASSLQPLNSSPFAPVAQDVVIQSIVFDDDASGDGSDDFALRFFSTLPNVSNGDSISAPFDLSSGSDTSEVQGNAFGLSFSDLNPGVYTSTDAQSQAFGGFTLVIVPEPTALVLLGLGGLLAIRRRH